MSPEGEERPSEAKPEESPADETPAAAGSPGGERLSARERRRLRVREQARRDMPKKTLKIVGLGAAGILVLAGAVWAFSYLSGLGDDCPLAKKHEHSSFAVFVPGSDGEPEQVHFVHEKFDMAGPGRPGILPSKAHLHTPNDWQVHHEYGCATVSEFLGYMTLELDEDRLQLDTIVNDGTKYPNEGNLTLKFYLFTPDPDDPTGVNGTWASKPDLPSYQPRCNERWLISYGDWSDTQVQAMQRTLRVPTDGCTG